MSPFFSSSMNPPLGLGIVDQDTVVLASVLAALGLVLLAAGWFGLLPAPGTARERSAGAAEGSVRVALAIAGFLVGIAFTGWLVLALFLAGFGWFVPTLRNAKRQRRDAIERVEAIAGWVESIRDNISGAAGLTQALRSSAAHAPEPIRGEVRDLVLRLQHEPLVPSLQKFAADVAHPTADMAVGCLILASARSAGSLSDILTNTAQAARDSASMMRHIEAGRAQTQAQAKMVAGIAGAMSFLMIVGDGEFLSPYDSAGGQVALFLICLLGAGSTIAMYRLGRPAPVERVFAGVETASFGAAARADAASRRA